MSNQDLYEERVKKEGKGNADTVGVSGDSFEDPSGEYPKDSYKDQSSVNKNRVTGKQFGIVTGSGLEEDNSSGSSYEEADIKETGCGHVLAFDDTGGSERITILHGTTKSGLEFRANGNMIIFTKENKIEVVNGTSEIIVRGDANITYEGNCTLNVSGDYEVNCNNYIVNAKGDKRETIDGSSRSKVFGNVGYTVSGSFSQTVGGSSVFTNLGNVTTATKGDVNSTTEGDVQITSSGKLTQSAQVEMNLTSPKMHQAADKIFIAGGLGSTIGGENVMMYTKNIYGTSGNFSDGFTAPTFHGDLKGTAVTSTVTQSQGYSEAAQGSAGSITDTANNTEATVEMTSALVTDFLKSDRGVRKPKIDVDNFLQETMRKRKYTVKDVRSKMRDKVNSDNPEWTTEQAGKGVLSETHSEKTPPAGTARVRDAGPTNISVESFEGTKNNARNKTIKVEKIQTAIQLLPSKEIIIGLKKPITSKTLVTNKIPLARFLYANDSGRFDSLPEKTKQQLARNYIAHGQLYKQILSVEGKWAKHRLEVVEGFHGVEKYGQTGDGTAETLTVGSILEKRTKGQAVVYELIGPNGKIDRDGSFELVDHWKQFGMFDKITLDYDTYDKDDELNVQIVVEVPDIPESFKVTYKGEIGTNFNNSVQSTGSIVEILSPEDEPEAIELKDKNVPTTKALEEKYIPPATTGKTFDDVSALYHAAGAYDYPVGTILTHYDSWQHQTAIDNQKIAGLKGLINPADYVPVRLAVWGAQGKTGTKKDGSFYAPAFVDDPKNNPAFGRHGSEAKNTHNANLKANGFSVDYKHPSGSNKIYSTYQWIEDNFF